MPQEFTLSGLNQELYNGPLATTLAPLLRAGYDHKIADILNDVNGASNGTIDLNSISKDIFLEGVAGGLSNLLQSNPTIQAKYTFLLNFIGMFDGVLNLKDATMLLFLSQAVSDNILTQDQVNVFTKRIGSRAEILWGTDFKVTSEQVSQAR